MGFKALNDIHAVDGTVRLVDASQQHLHLGKSNIVLVPQPSADPNDPLRWPQWRKMLAFGSICLFTFLTTWSVNGPSGGFVNIADYFNVGLNQATGLLNWSVLTLGLANFFWVPVGLYFGKRPTFITACSLLFVCCIWQALAQSFESLLAGTIVGAFAGAATEVLVPATVNDIFFLHERGAKMGYYIVAISWGSNIGPLCGGFIIEHLGWRWQKWISTILTGINVLMVIFFLPETRFRRDAVDQSTFPDGFNEPKETMKVQPQRLSDEALEKTGRTPSHKPKSYVQQLNPWSGIDRQLSYINLNLRPFPLALYPACAFAFLGYAINLAPPVAFSSVSSFVLQAPPYNFSAGLVGLLGVPGLIGNLAGAIGGGILTDIWAQRQARRNNGIFEPETRLTLLLFPAAADIVGLLMIGFGLEKKLSWVVIYVGFAFLSVGLTGVANIGMTYVMDSYFPIAAECLLLVNGLKNVFAFGFAYAAIPWAESQGYARCFGGLLGIYVAILLLAVPLWSHGAKIRHHTASKWKLISW